MLTPSIRTVSRKSGLVYSTFRVGRGRPKKINLRYLTEVATFRQRQEEKAKAEKVSI